MALGVFLGNFRQDPPKQKSPGIFPGDQGLLARVCDTVSRPLLPMRPLHVVSEGELADRGQGFLQTLKVALQD